MSRLFFIAALHLALLTANSLAIGRDMEVAGIQVPNHVQLSDKALTLNGAGLRRWYGLGIYVAALYLPKREQDALAVLDHEAPRTIWLTLLRDISAEQNMESLKDGLIANNSQAEMQAVATEVSQFLGLLRQAHQVAAGTVIRLDYSPGVGTTLRIGNRTMGTIPGEPFNRTLLKIWLGQDPIQVSLKKALLGAEGTDL